MGFRVKVGFVTLRDLAMLRPPLRSDAMDVLFSLTTHADRPTRGAAILTIKRWVPDVQPLAQMGLNFALHLLKRLEITSNAPNGHERSGPDQHEENTIVQSEQEDGMDNGTDSIVIADSAAKADVVKRDMAVVEAGQVVAGLPEAKSEQEVAQHIELLLGLVSKSPDLLDE